MIKTILFDVDGTIVDTQKVVLSTFKEVIKEYLNANVNINDLAFALGIPGRDAIKHFTNNKVLINKMAKSWSEKLVTELMKIHYLIISLKLSNLYLKRELL